MTTFWLYYNGEPIYAVRMPQTATAEDIRTRAMEQHRLTPLCYPMAPATFAARLYHARIVRG